MQGCVTPEKMVVTMRRNITGEKKYHLWLLLAIACCQSVFAQGPVNEEKSVPALLAIDSLAPAIDTSRLPAKPQALFRVRNIVIEGNK